MAIGAVWDPERIASRADYADHFIQPEGVEAVIVSGEIVVSQNVLTGARPGKIPRRGSQPF